MQPPPKGHATQFYSLRAFLSSLFSSCLMFSVSLVAFIVLFHTRQGRIFLLSRNSLFKIALDLQTPLRLLRYLVKLRSKDIAHDYGIEAALFDRYLWFLSSVFVALSTLICPAVAGLRAVTGWQGVTNRDPLHSLNWIFSQQTSAQSWFYTLAVLITVFMILCLLTWEVKSAMRFRREMLSEKYRRKLGHSILLSSIPSRSLCHKMLLKSCPQLRYHISEPDLHLEQKQKLKEDIERRELQFLKQMIKRLPAESEKQISQAMNLRYQDTSALTSFAKISSEQPIVKLYEKYLTLGGNNTNDKGLTSLIVRTYDAATARYVADRLRVEHDQDKVHYIGRGTVLQFDPPHWIKVQLLRFTVRVIIVILTIIWTVPLSACGLLSQLGPLLEILSPNQQVVLPGKLVAVLQGVLPGLASSILMSLFLPSLRWLVAREAHLTDIQNQKAIQRYYFTFLYLQLFLTTSISSGCIPIIIEFINKGLTNIPLTLAQNFPLSSDYFLSYMLVQALTSGATSLLPIRPLVQRCLQPFGAKTPRQILNIECSALLEIAWGEIYPLYSTIAVIAICYALMSPLILPLAALAFCLAALCYRYVMTCKSYVRTDTDGQLYPSALSTCFVALYTFESCSLGLFMLRVSKNLYREDIGRLIIIVVAIYITIQWQYILAFYINEQVDRGIDDQAVMDQNVPSFGRLPRYLCYTKDLQFDHNQDVIWIPRDVHGLSGALKEAVHRRFADYPDFIVLGTSTTDTTGKDINSL